MTSRLSAGDLVVPATTLTFLRRSLRKEAGPLAATHALHGAGYESGAPILGDLRSFLRTEELGAVEEGEFWSRLSAFFDRRGWGSFSHERVHPGMATLRSGDWAEADAEGGETQPGCAFTCGMLAFILSEIADGPMAVLEVDCRSRGDAECRFLFGSEAGVHEVYGLLLDGTPLARALARV